jgi:hypothetical protein
MAMRLITENLRKAANILRVAAVVDTVQQTWNAAHKNPSTFIKNVKLWFENYREDNSRSTKEEKVEARDAIKNVTHGIIKLDAGELRVNEEVVSYLKVLKSVINEIILLFKAGYNDKEGFTAEAFKEFLSKAPKGPTAPKFSVLTKTPEEILKKLTLTMAAASHIVPVKNYLGTIDKIKDIKRVEPVVPVLQKIHDSLDKVV